MIHGQTILHAQVRTAYKRFLRSNQRRFYLCAVYALVSGLLALSLSAARAGEDSGFYPGKLGIARAQNLTPQEREVEARFA